MGEGRQKGGRCRCGGAPTCNVTPLFDCPVKRRQLMGQTVYKSVAGYRSILIYLFQQNCNYKSAFVMSNTFQRTFQHLVVFTAYSYFFTSAYSYFCISNSYCCIYYFMKEQFKNLTYVCHSLFADILSIFWEIAPLVSTALASTALASTTLVSTAIVSYTHFVNYLKSVIFGVELFKKHFSNPVFDYWTLVIQLFKSVPQIFILYEV